MAHPYPVDTVISAGMKRDFNRAQMPGGSAWNLVDLIPDQLGAPLRGRGGWSYGDSGAMTSVTSIKAVIYAPFSGGSKLLAIGQNAELWRFDTGPTDIGAALVPGGPPAYYRGKVIIPGSDGTTAPKYYDGTTLGNLAGSPPAGQLATAYKDHAILAKSSANDNRIWFSAAGDPTSWNTSAGYLDVTGTITAIAPLKSMVLVFHADATERIRGSIPPPGTDFILESFLSVGCLDPFSVAQWNDRVVFANAKGVYMTDGAGWADLTARAGMSTYYQTQMASYATSWRLGGGIYRNHYILSINNGSTVVDTLVFNLQTGAMWRFSNFHGNCFAQVATGGVEECYMGLGNAGRVGKLSTCWAPVAAVKKDGDATVLTQTFETIAHQGWDRLHRRWIPSDGQQRWKYLYYSYNLTDYASDSPSLTFSYVNTPDSTSYTSLATTAASTSATTRGRRQISTGNKSNSIAFKVAQSNPGDLRLFSLALVYDPLEVGALGGVG